MKVSDIVACVRKRKRRKGEERETRAHIFTVIRAREEEDLIGFSTHDDDQVPYFLHSSVVQVSLEFYSLILL